MLLQNKLLFLLAADFALTFAHSKEVDYCSVSSCKPRKHVMCEFPDPGGDSECGVGHKPYPLTEKQKTELLQWHNQVRSGVALSTSEFVTGGGFARPVSNMLEMKWSKELEQFAQRWADQCNVVVQREHDQCRNTLLSDTKSEAGQIVYQHTYSTESDTVSLALGKLKKAWTKAPLVMPRQKEKLSGPREWILQVTWPSASTLGCAMSHFTNGTDRILLIVCNYGATVGSMGGPRYGPTCTNCPPPNQCSNDMPGLCEAAGEHLRPTLLAVIVGLALAFYGVDDLARGRD